MSDTDAPIQLEDVRRLNIRHGDILVIRVKKRLTSRQYTNFADTTRKAFPGVRCVILDEGVDIEVVRRDLDE